MRKLILQFIVLTLALAACAGPASQATEPAALPVTRTEEVPAVTAEATAEIMAEPTVASTVEPTAGGTAAAPSQGEAAASRVVAYTLVPEETTVSYEVGETFIDQGNVFNLAVGTTQGVTGEVQVNFDDPQVTTVSALTLDITGFRSDSSRRDSAIQDRFLQTAQFPTVIFTPTMIEGLPETIEQGVEYPITLRGDLTIRDTTKPAAFDTRVRLEGETLTGQAVTTFLMSDFGFGPIDMLGILKTEDEVKITVDFVARPS